MKRYSTFYIFIIDILGSISIIFSTPESVDAFTCFGFDEANPAVCNGYGTCIAEDTCDYCPDDPDKTEAGVCGCGVADTDTDNDGTADCNDTDDDNDGIPDEWEVTYGLNPLVNDTSLDFDNDGFFNLDEYKEGTNPSDPRDQPFPWELFYPVFINKKHGTPEPHTIHFTGEELLGIPTAASITINIVPDETIDYYYQYGTSPGVYTEQTSVMIADADQPHEIVIKNLTPNTKYFYRMQYRAPGYGWITRDEYSFRTQRTARDTFVFTITADPHATATENHKQTMANLIDDQADFHIDLGDTFMIDNLTSQEAINGKYLVQRDPLFFGGIGHYAPVFLAIGNHEDEEGWNFDDAPFSTALGSVQARKAFFPTPVDQGAGGFYSGNTDILPDIDKAIYGDQYREDYYAWEWGDALFVVIDPFHYTMELPYQQGTAGEGYDDPVTGDQWSWTLGAQQFNWFKQTLENSTAKYKFVFSHNVTGGILRPIIGVAPGYVRGGAEAAAYFEWGGYNADGTWGFSDHRDPADFGDTPIHQIMVNNNVSAFFHGHDHMFAYEIRDGIVYQEVPSAGFNYSFPRIYNEDETNPDYDTIAVFMSMLGHLRVTVTSNEVTVEFVRSSSTNQSINKSVQYTYTIPSAERKASIRN